MNLLQNYVSKQRHMLDRPKVYTILEVYILKHIALAEQQISVIIPPIYNGANSALKMLLN